MAKGIVFRYDGDTYKTWQKAERLIVSLTKGDNSIYFVTDADAARFIGIRPDTLKRAKRTQKTIHGYTYARGA